MASNPTFMYGPKDGAVVPEMLWALDEIILREKHEEGNLIHKYVLNYDDKSYYYKGVFPDDEE